MPDLLCTTSAAGKIRLYLEWQQTNPNRCVLQYVRCENDHPTGTATYGVNWRGSQVHSVAFPPMQVTRVALPAGITLGLVDGLPDWSDAELTYTGPIE